ncbi:MAG: NAD(P)H-hydrate dehydratase [Lachnospiraceae bacterium]|nr:NAD(P)H-hydrate dehydratase [Lachnospiraceae bacterium]
MRYLVSAAEMRRYDSNTIEKIGIPACVLMERAALAAAELVWKRCSGKSGKRVLIMAGMGNNGGDGLAAGRLLAEKGCQVEIWNVGDPGKASPQRREQQRILESWCVEYTERPERQEYDIMIDALFGVGLSREIEGEAAEAIGLFNAFRGWKLALDIPSGIDSDTGAVRGCAVRADATVAFGFCKRGAALYPGCGYAGKIRIADIGISERSFYGRAPEMYAYDGPAAELLPKRSGNGNKGTFGKVLLAAGSDYMAGAAVLAARAAYRAGAGMVKVLSSESNRTILQQAVPEALLGRPENLEEDMGWADVLAVGPGIGKGEKALYWLEKMIHEGRKPLLVDADGLNLLSEHSGLRTILAGQGLEGRKIILTPHVGELSRLIGKSIAECKAALPEYAGELADGLHATVAAKDARSFVCAQGHPICANLCGNSGMATAGSGDVLAGIIAGLLAQRMDAFEAAAAGVYIHAKAGDLAAQEMGEHACMAGDIADRIGLHSPSRTGGKDVRIRRRNLLPNDFIS